MFVDQTIDQRPGGRWKGGFGAQRGHSRNGRWGLTSCWKFALRHSSTPADAINRAATVHGVLSLAQVIVWVIVGLVGGSLAGFIVTWKRRGFGLLQNLGMGLVGAVVGGLLFRLLGLFPGLDAVAISLRDIVAAFAGTLLVLAVLWIGHWSRAGAAAPGE